MDGEHARYHEKYVSKGFVAFMAIPALFATALGVSILLTPAWPAALAPFLAAGIVALTTLFFSAMRTTVTRTTLAVQYGTLGPTVPLAAIESAEIATLGMLERLAFGPKYRGPDGWSYISPGQTRGVRVRWRDGEKVRQILVGARDADALLAAIEAGRSGDAHRTPAVRVADPDAAGASAAEAEAEDSSRDRARARSVRRAP